MFFEIFYIKAMFLLKQFSKTIFSIKTICVIITHFLGFILNKNFRTNCAENSFITKNRSMSGCQPMTFLSTNSLVLCLFELNARSKFLSFVVQMFTKTYNCFNQFRIRVHDYGISILLFRLRFWCFSFISVWSTDYICAVITTSHCSG